MVKIRKNRQPRNWQNNTKERSASGFVAALPDITSQRIKKETIRRHIEKRRQPVHRDGSDAMVKVKGVGNEFQISELPLAQQITMVRHAMKKCYRRIKRFREVIAKNQNNDVGVEYRAKEQRELDIISEKVMTIANLERRLLARKEAQKTIAINEEKAIVAAREKTNEMVERLEKQGYYEELDKKRKFAKANAKLKGNLASDVDETYKTHKRFTEQPRAIRGQNQNVVVIKGKKKSEKILFEKRTIKIN